MHINTHTIKKNISLLRLTCTPTGPDLKTTMNRSIIAEGWALGRLELTGRPGSQVAALDGSGGFKRAPWPAAQSHAPMGSPHCHLCWLARPDADARTENPRASAPESLACLLYPQSLSQGQALLRQSAPPCSFLQFSVSPLALADASGFLFSAGAELSFPK